MPYEVFDVYWYRYEKWFEEHRITVENEVKAVNRVLQGYKPALEVGVGTGYFASRLGIELGVEPSVNMAKIARSRGVEVVLGFGEYLPFRSSSLGEVLLIVALCFVDNPKLVLSEVFRVLKCGGKVHICIIPKTSKWGKYYMERRKSSPFYSIAKFYDITEVSDMLKSQGFKIEGCVSTLINYGPEDKEVKEEPFIGCYNGGFTCITGTKVC